MTLVFQPGTFDFLKPKPKPPLAHVRSEDGLYSPEMLAERWVFSEKKVWRILEGYRSYSGFRDFGSPENVYTHKRRFAVIRITAELLAKIEADFGGKKR